ncbi:hypothetical protein ACN27G_19330 [Plantactinospora sp. WMMB334]|uniref:hypothetical protein n=1 Tax=Plantactinospora sp. WMMB334 TaxID=3404119 RepID=UPI003B942986
MQGYADERTAMNNGLGAMAGVRSHAPTTTRGIERQEYQRLDGLFDLWLRTDADNRLVAARDPATPLDATALADIVRRGGGAGDDVRVMMGNAAEHRRLFAELAGVLGRDVHISPARSDLRHGHGARQEPTLVDTVTGRPVDWLVVQPPAMATGLPGWYETAGGVLRPRTGIVAAPLPGGVTLATRADFVARRAAAADLAAGHPELTTIGAVVRGGGFVIGDYTGAYQTVGGRRLAAALSEIPLYGAEVRMWIRWPFDGDEQALLDGNLAAFAENTGAIVWAPERNALTEILESCRDLSAVDRTGGPATWRAYAPPAAGSPRFESDQDGRLSPVEKVVSTYPGVPLVSVERDRERSTAPRYARLKAQHGLFRIDLTVLADGRWAAQYAGTGPHALGPRALQLMLRSAGWQGEDLLLLARYPESAASGMRYHGSRLVDGLRAQVWVLPPDADFDIVGGAARAVDRHGRPVGWQRLDPSGSPRRWHSETRRWHSEDGVLVSADRSGLDPAGAGGIPEASPEDPRHAAGPVIRPGRPAPAAPPTPPTSTRPEVATTRPGIAVGGPEVATSEPEVAAGGAEVAASEPEVAAGGADVQVSPTPALATSRRRMPHGIDWLADRPRVNTEPVELYVVSPCPPAEAVDRGVPTPHLFLVGTLRPPAPGTLAGGEQVLRVRVAPGGAVDMSSINVHEPPAVQALLADRAETYLLPGGLLGRTRLVASCGVEASGRFAIRGTFPGEPALALRCSGAEHGIEGLPNDLSRWPWQSEAIAYAMLPGPTVVPSHRALVLLRRRPRVRAGRRLLELRVPWRRAVDVRATAAQLSRLAQVRSTAPALRAAGVEMLLPGGEYERVRVVRVLVAGRFGWRTVSDSPTTPAEVLRTAGGHTDRPGRPIPPAAPGPGPGPH